MKTLKFFLLVTAFICLLLACSKSIDEPAPATSQPTLKSVNLKGTGTVSFYGKTPIQWPVFCNGIQVDFLVGNLDFHYVMHFKNIGESYWVSKQCTGEAVSSKSDEVFLIKIINHKEDPTNAFTYIYYNMVGNKGSHYVGTFALNLTTGIVTNPKALCPGSK